MPREYRSFIRLYRAPWSTNVQRVHLALDFKGLLDEVESVWITYDDRTPVEQVSGQGLVPVIDHDGTVVSDSLAILRHLETFQPDPPLWPAEPAARAEIDVFLDWFDSAWKVAPNAIDAELETPEPDRAAIAAHGALLAQRMDLFEGLLSGRDYLFGAFSAADCAAYPFLKYALGKDPQDPDRFHDILAEHLSVEARPATEEWLLRMGRRASPAGLTPRH